MLVKTSRKRTKETQITISVIILLDLVFPILDQFYQKNWQLDQNIVNAFEHRSVLELRVRWGSWCYKTSFSLHSYVSS